VLDDATGPTGITATTGTATFSSPNLTWTGNLAAGASATITYQATVKSSGFGNARLVNNVASTTGGATCVICTTNTPLALLAITKTASPSGTVAPGAKVTYTVTLVNNGTTPYPSVSISDNLSDVLDDATFNNDQQSNGGGAFTFTSPTLSWNGLLNNGTPIVLTYSVTTKTTFAGNENLVNKVTSTSPGANCVTGAESGCTTTVAMLLADVQLTKTGPASLPAGGQAAYTLTVQNNGPSASGTITVTDTLPAGLTFVSGTGCTAAGQNVTCTVASLNSGASTPLTLTVAVAAGQSGSIVNSATATGTVTDPNPANNTSTTAAIPVTVNADLSVTKTGAGHRRRRAHR
jgi:uncharacterized repeat protein (TIGR01451 family)/fimbrial isopeptide formation D2 family protein